MTPEQLARTIEGFLLEATDAVVMEDGEAIFDLAVARYTVMVQQNKCLLHLWSEERNTVRRVVQCEPKDGWLRLMVQKFGQPQPSPIEICRERDQRTAATKKAQRHLYQRRFARVLRKIFPSYELERLSNSIDLEHSFGPIYTRALIRKGGSAWALLGVNEDEVQASVDAALTFGLLWLERCRAENPGGRRVEGLALFLPPGRSGVVRARTAYLNHAAAKLRVFELAELNETAEELDAQDAGNIATHLVPCLDRSAAEQRFTASIQRIKSIVPEVEIVIQSPTEVLFRLHGLEFARARLMLMAGTFQQQQVVTFGAGRFETTLHAGTEAKFVELMARLRAARDANAIERDALWRMQPERWLESLVIKDLSAIDLQLDQQCVYSQVPAFAATDRGMIDVLACTRTGRLAVVELKANEDIHLPLQGIDYWARVKWHHDRSEFQQHGYFPGRLLSAETPLLLLVAPALRIHPATDTLLRYVDPRIEWTLVGIGEEWRHGIQSVFRKKSPV